jgi:hypothetical protein
MSLLSVVKLIRYALDERSRQCASAQSETGAFNYADGADAK